MQRSSPAPLIGRRISVWPAVLLPFGIVAAGPSQPLSAFIAPVRANRGERVTTLVAVSSTGAGSTLEFVLRLPDGTEVRGGRASLTLSANGHVARSLDQLFPGVDLRDFRGTVTVNGDGAAITAIVMQLGTAEGSGVVLPVLEVY